MAGPSLAAWSDGATSDPAIRPATTAHGPTSSYDWLLQLIIQWTPNLSFREP